MSQGDGGFWSDLSQFGQYLSNRCSVKSAVESNFEIKNKFKKFSASSSRPLGKTFPFPDPERVMKMPAIVGCIEL
jgi:hypothetical protein